MQCHTSTETRTHTHNADPAEGNTSGSEPNENSQPLPAPSPSDAALEAVRELAKNLQARLDSLEHQRTALDADDGGSFGQQNEGVCGAGVVGSGSAVDVSEGGAKKKGPSLAQQLLQQQYELQVEEEGSVHANGEGLGVQKGEGGSAGMEMGGEGGVSERERGHFGQEAPGVLRQEQQQAQQDKENDALQAVLLERQREVQQLRREAAGADEEVSG